MSLGEVVLWLELVGAVVAGWMAGQADTRYMRIQSEDRDQGRARTWIRR